MGEDVCSVVGCTVRERPGSGETFAEASRYKIPWRAALANVCSARTPGVLRGKDQDGETFAEASRHKIPWRAALANVRSDRSLGVLRGKDQDGKDVR